MHLHIIFLFFFFTQQTAWLNCQKYQNMWNESSETLIAPHPNKGGSNSPATSAQKLGHGFYYCNRNRKAIVLDHEVSNGTRAQSCSLPRLKAATKTKALTAATVFMRGGLRLCCPARPGTFLVTLNHCLFTLSRELNELRLRALPGKLRRPHPTLPPIPPPPLPPQTLCSLQPPPATSPPPHVVHSHKRSFSSNMGWIHARVFFLLFFF